VRRDFIARGSSAGLGLGGIEVRSKQRFSALGPGDWLECDEDEVFSLLYAQDELVYVAANCREKCTCGWLLASVVKLEPYYEFYVRLGSLTSPSGQPKCLGLVWAKSITFVNGLVVVAVRPNSLFAEWNAHCRCSFPRNQVLPGDFITWVENQTSPEKMEQILLPIGSGGSNDPHVLRLRISRVAGSIASACGKNIADLIKEPTEPPSLGPTRSLPCSGLRADAPEFILNPFADMDGDEATAFHPMSEDSNATASSSPGVSAALAWDTTVKSAAVDIVAEAGMGHTSASAQMLQGCGVSTNQGSYESRDEANACDAPNNSFQLESKLSAFDRFQ